MRLLTFLKHALTPIDGPSPVVADHDRDDGPAWFSLGLQAPAIAESPDNLARLSLSATGADSAARSDFGRWM